LIIWPAISSSTQLTKLDDDDRVFFVTLVFCFVYLCLFAARLPLTPCLICCVTDAVVERRKWVVSARASCIISEYLPGDIVFVSRYSSKITSSPLLLFISQITLVTETETAGSLVVLCYSGRSIAPVTSIMFVRATTA